MSHFLVITFACVLLSSIAVVAEQAKPDADEPLAAPSDERSEEDNVVNVAHSTDNAIDVELNATVENRTASNAIFIYRRLLRQKREMQKDAVKMILASESYEKQYKMIKMIFTKLFVVLTQSKVRLMEAGYTPGDAFPNVEDVKDALSMVLENTAFAGDIVLRLPDISHSLLKGNTEWSVLIQWAVGFCNDTQIFTGSDAILLSTMAQELDLVEKDPNYVNPYREDTKLSKQAADELERNLAESKKRADRAKVRKEKKKQKGPRMSAPRHNEL